MITLEKVTSIKGSDLKWRLIRTLSLLLSYSNHGMFLGAIGPTMLDIQLRTSSSITETTYIVVGRAIGLLLGCFLAIPITAVIDSQLCIALALIISNISGAIVPWPKSVIGTIASFFIAGIGYGIEETCLVMNMLFLWGSECEPFMQALHFAFGLGASIAPLIAREFILPRNESFIDEWSPEDVHIHWCYGSISICGIVTAIIFIWLGNFAPKSDEHPSRLISDNAHQIDDRNIDPNDSKKEQTKIQITKCICIILACLFIFFYFGIEVNFGTYISPYAVDGPIKMSKTNGALIASVYWFVFTFSRLVSVLYINFIGSRNNLILCSTILLASNIVLLPFYDSETCLWVGTVIVGIGASSIFASIFGFIEKSIKITPLITSFTIASACLGNSIFPIATGQLFEQDKKVFLWLSLGAMSAMAFVLGLVILSFNYYDKIAGSNDSLPVTRSSIGRLHSIASIRSSCRK